MYKTVNNVANLLIAKDINRSISPGSKVEASTLADGEVVLTDKYGREIEATALLNATEFFVVQGQGASKPLIKSDLISVSAVKSVKRLAYTAPNEQVDVIGTFGGVTPAGLYEIRVLEQGITTVFGNHLQEMIVGYTAKNSDTAISIASRLTKDLSKEVSKRANPNFKVERIKVSGTPTALASNASVTKGSELVVSTGHALVKGDVVELAGVIYVVAEIPSVNAANAFIIDQPYQGATAGAVVASKLASVTLNIRLTGLAKKFAVGKFRYEKNRWATTVQGEGMASDAITVTTSALAKEGSGTYEQVAEFEWFAQGFEGVLERIQVPPVTFRANVEEGATYDIYTIEFTDALSSTSITGAIPVSHKQLYIATKVASLGDQGAKIKADLEDILNVSL